VGGEGTVLEEGGAQFAWASELGEGNVARICRRYLFAMCVLTGIAFQCSDIVLFKHPTAGACDFGVSLESYYQMW